MVIVANFQTSSNPGVLASSERDEPPLASVSHLLRTTVDEIRRLDGSPVVQSIICSLLSTLSRNLVEDMCTMYVLHPSVHYSK